MKKLSTADVCKQFRQNSNIDPSTNLEINENSRMYKYLIKLCDEYEKQNALISESKSLIPKTKLSRLSVYEALPKLSHKDIDILINKSEDDYEYKTSNLGNEIQIDPNIYIMEYCDCSLKSILTKIKLYNDINRADIKIGKDAVEFLNEITYEMYNKLTSSSSYLQLYNEIDSYPEYISIAMKKLLNPKLTIKENVINIINYLLREIMELSINGTRDENNNTLSYRMITYVIKMDQELNDIFGKAS